MLRRNPKPQASFGLRPSCQLRHRSFQSLYIKALTSQAHDASGKKPTDGWIPTVVLFAEIGSSDPRKLKGSTHRRYTLSVLIA
jgi:hypothetical protein